eukprot:7537853-Prorocentrum_lima.AAC.1
MGEDTPQEDSTQNYALTTQRRKYRQRYGGSAAVLAPAETENPSRIYARYRSECCLPFCYWWQRQQKS